MAKTISEWQKAFVDLFEDMCKDLDAAPGNTSVKVHTHCFTYGPFEPVAFKIRTIINFE